MNIRQRFSRYKEILLYLLFGVATTAVNFAVYSVAVELLHWDLTLGNAVAWLCAVIFAFITNKLLVFNSRSFRCLTLLKEGLSFFGARAASGVIEVVVPPWLYGLGLTADLFGIKGITAKLLVSVIVIVLNYIFSKWWTFRKS